MKAGLAALLALILGITLTRQASGNASPLQTPGRLVVSPDGPYVSLEAALADANNGDTIEVRGGTYTGPLLVEKTVSLEGLNWPVIDGGGKGTVVTLAAPGIVFQGFEIRGSGIEPDRDHAGITLTAQGITVAGNRLYDVLFGIFLAQADDAVIHGNDITSIARFDTPRKGDGIRLWYSQNATVTDNHVHQARDIVMWYSSGVMVQDNIIEGGRYGIHLMYCNDASVTGNRLRNNSVGIFTMYSEGVDLLKNDIRGQRGPSGYALGFKDADDVKAHENLLVDNRAGIYLDGTPYSAESAAHFAENIIAFNDIGVITQIAVHGAAFEGNTFWENAEQVALQGGGKPGENAWNRNYWSDYAGFDANGDGLGDLPYHADRFFENLTDREPLLRVLNYSPASQAIEFAASAFPIFKPQPKFIDLVPSTLPTRLPASLEPAGRWSIPLASAGIGLLSIIIISGYLTLRFLTFKPGDNIMQINSPQAGEPDQLNKDSSPEIPISALSEPRPAVVRVDGVSKRYHGLKVLDGVSFESPAGQALALWGANGAGKTTLIKAILGLIEYEGKIQVMGLDTLREGKAARSYIGYVPQETVFYDMSVQATMLFYARLKMVNPSCIPALLTKLGLKEHARKPVPTLSGGLKQRLALAIALLSDPPVLLLDEPTASLDAQGRRDYLALLVTLRNEQKTIIFASHRLEEVETLADRVLVMETGQVTEEHTPADLRRLMIPEVELTLWVVEDQRSRTLAILKQEGLDAHLNGRGTVIVLIPTENKLQLLHTLAQQGIQVLDFEMEKGPLWN